MHIHRVHRLRRHDDPMPEKAFRSLVFLISIVVFAFTVFGFLRDAEAQFHNYSLPNGAGGWNYHSAPGYGYGDSSDGMLNLGIQMMQMGNQAEMQRRQHRHERDIQDRQWTAEKARANWGRQ